VSIRAQYPWYWKAAAAALLLAMGYGLGYWHFGTRHALVDTPEVEAFLAQLAVTERQLQVERATRSNAAKEMALLQDEVMQLKEDVAFYKGILVERGASSGPQFQDMKITRTKNPAEYRYQVRLVQLGQQAKPMQGVLRLTVQGLQDGKSVSRNVDLNGKQAGMMVNFKNSRQVEGVFTVPETMQAKSVLLEFLGSGDDRPRLSQTFNLPE
jgi:hypothetical protein